MSVAACGITIVGLGPGDPDLRTLGAQRALDAARRIVLRTRIHPGLDDLRDDPRVSSCDDLYEGATDFETLYGAIAERVVAVAREAGAVVYAVPGHPRIGERTVPLIVGAARVENFPVEILDAVSFIDAALTASALDPLAAGLQIVDAEQIAATVDAEPYAAGLLGLEPTRPLLVGQVYDATLATAVKLGLARLYPDRHPAILLRAAGVCGEESVEQIALHELDRQAVDHLTSLVVAPLAPLDAARSSEALPRVVARLRAPGGCPWDRKQTHASLRDAILEEAYETVDAIDAGDSAGLSEELGDLLLLIAMHAQLAEEEGTFRLEDVYEGITRKLIRRHPHVFGDVTAETPDAVVVTWEGVKAAERAAAGIPARPAHPLDALPRAMPITRKATELLAPRAVLAAPANPTDGLPLLAALRDLLARGIDPERALEAVLRNTAVVGTEITNTISD
jgi:tetrapyrrole methylase family protein/MazG family protein